MSYSFFLRRLSIACNLSQISVAASSSKAFAALATEFDSSLTLALRALALVANAYLNRKIQLKDNAILVHMQKILVTGRGSWTGPQGLETEEEEG